MSDKAGSDGEAIAPTSLPEKVTPEPVVVDVVTFDIDSQDLPKGYYRSPLFIGTLIAQGLSVAAVRSISTSTS